jgi:hypothetical protein
MVAGETARTKTTAPEGSSQRVAAPHDGPPCRRCGAQLSPRDPVCPVCSLPRAERANDQNGSVGGPSFTAPWMWDEGLIVAWAGIAVALVSLVAAIALTPALLWHIATTGAFLQRAVDAQGIVTAISTEQRALCFTDSATKVQTYRPTVHFTTPDGRAITTVVEGSADLQTPFALGQVVPLVYDPAAPSRARLSRSLYCEEQDSLLLVLTIAGIGVYAVAKPLLFGADAPTEDPPEARDTEHEIHDETFTPVQAEAARARVRAAMQEKSALRREAEPDRYQ